MINAEQFRKLPDADKKELFDSLSEEQAIAIYYDWEFWARETQLQPKGLGESGRFIWLYLAGRGTGKTRTFSEWIIDGVQNKGYRHISLVGAAADEVRDIMILGESGIMAYSPPWFKPRYVPSNKLIVWPNGAEAHIFYGTEPEKSRGAQSDMIWCDEICKWQYPDETFDNIMMGLRLGNNPVCGISTTPKPIKLIKELVKDDRCIVVKEGTHANKDNLAPAFISTVLKKYEGTRLGRQELNGEILDDNPNALWIRRWIDEYRITKEQMPDLRRVVIPIDPAVTSNENSDDTGIIPCGEGAAPNIPNVKNPDLMHYYILDDATMKGTPLAWGARAIDRYRFYRADKIIGETNNGGDLIESNLRNIDRNISYAKVHASRGKYTRAEPIAALYEQGRVHHVGFFPALEDELCEYEFTSNEPSPNRLDSMVWGVSYLAEKMVGTSIKITGI